MFRIIKTVFIVSYGIASIYSYIFFIYIYLLDKKNRGRFMAIFTRKWRVSTALIELCKPNTPLHHQNCRSKKPNARVTSLRDVKDESR